MNILGMEKGYCAYAMLPKINQVVKLKVRAKQSRKKNKKQSVIKHMIRMFDTLICMQ